MSKNTNIWKNVNEKTIKLLITDWKDVFSPGGEGTHFKKYKLKPKYFWYQPKTIILKSPECVIISLNDHPKIKLTDLKSMPQNLPNLESIVIHLNPEKPKLKYLTGMPQSLPKLKYLSIVGAQIQSLRGFPSELPSLEILMLDHIPINSLEYLPDSLPKLQKLGISNTPIQTLEFFPTDTPNLKEIYIKYNKLISLKGLPSYIPALEKLNVSSNQLTSLEDLPYKFNKKRYFRFPLINYNNNPIRTFSGVKIPKFLESKIPYSFQLCPAFRKLYKKLKNIQAEYEIRLGKYLEQDEYDSGLIQTLSHDFDDVEMTTAEEFEQYRNEIASLKKAIIEFYKKTPMELAQQYIENPDSLTETELERLGWESGYKERQLLESNLPPENTILSEISKRLTHKLPSGFSILK